LVQLTRQLLFHLRRELPVEGFHVLAKVVIADAEFSRIAKPALSVKADVPSSSTGSKPISVAFSIEECVRPFQIKAAMPAIDKLIPHRKPVPVPLCPSETAKVSVACVTGIMSFV
jgi:hypothetical protein